MKNKLVEIITNTQVNCVGKDCNKCSYSGQEHCLINRVADSLIANGIIVPPCEVGDKFYGIQSDCYFKYEVLAIVINHKGIWLETTYEMRFLYGSDAFLTEEEAKAKIKENENESK